MSIPVNQKKDVNAFHIPLLHQRLRYLNAKSSYKFEESIVALHDSLSTLNMNFSIAFPTPSLLFVSVI